MCVNNVYLLWQHSYIVVTMLILIFIDEEIGLEKLGNFSKVIKLRKTETVLVLQM
jgi:hypothetical protein